MEVSEGCAALTTFCDGEPSVQNVWGHTDEASWLIVTPPLKSTCHVVATSQAFMLCWHGQTYTVLCCRWACSLGLRASQCLVASRQEVAGDLWQGDGSTAARASLCRRAFICLLLGNRYSCKQGLLHGEQSSSLFSDTDSLWCRGSYNKSPISTLWDDLCIEVACS